MEVCNALEVSANKKARYGRMEVAQKVIDIKTVLKKTIIHLKQPGKLVFHVVRRDIGWIARGKQDYVLKLNGFLKARQEWFFCIS